jgi:hypothetical protein
MAMEYFFLLELVRPLLIWWVLGEEYPIWQNRLKRSLLHWLPYLLVFLGAAFWRAFFFRFQTQNYQPLLLEGLRNEPLTALLNLAGNILLSLWDVLVLGWFRAFTLPVPVELGARTSLFYWLLVSLTLVLTVTFLILFKPRQNFPNKPNAWPAVLTGVAACFIAGWPFWLIDLRPSLFFPQDRFTLPFILGACLIAAGLLLALPLRQWMRLTILALLLSFSVGYQFQLGNQYRRDWETQKRFFWQMSWRIPALRKTRSCSSTICQSLSTVTIRLQPPSTGSMRQRTIQIG